MKHFSLPLFYLTLIFFPFILNSCTSSLRYTTKENTETKSPTNKSYSNLTETYSNYKSLETNIVVASYYSDEFNGKRTANGEIYNMYELTAAHTDYPFNTIVRITNMSNEESVIVRINDRKPNTNGRALDLSLKAAHELRMISSGIAKVKVEVLEWGSK